MYTTSSFVITDTSIIKIYFIYLGEGEVTYNVRYIHGGRESNIESKYISLFETNIGDRKISGRCRLHCTK